MAKWILLLCGLLFSASALQAGEPDEGGIGGTGVIFDAPEPPEVSDVPGVPDAPDSLDVPEGMDASVSAASVPSIDVPSGEVLVLPDTVTTMGTSSLHEVVPLPTPPISSGPGAGSITIINSSQ